MADAPTPTPAPPSTSSEKAGPDALSLALPATHDSGPDVTLVHPMQNGTGTNRNDILTATRAA